MSGGWGAPRKLKADIMSLACASRSVSDGRLKTDSMNFKTEAKSIWSWSMTPRLGLDLEGGTELVLQPQLTGTETISEGQVNRAVDIIRQRIDANGVSEAEITTQGGRSIVVSIPGQPTKEQLDALKKPSQLRFRAVYVQAKYEFGGK